MAFSDSLTRMRRFLRDPSAAIWSDADLMLWFNEAQLEVAQKTGVLEKVEAHYYPPQFNYAYCFEWERTYCEGDLYQAFVPNQIDGSICTSIWETAWWLDDNDMADEGPYCSQPWEVFYCTATEPVRVPLHQRFHKMRFCAFDLQEITPISQKELGEQDRFYKTREGLPLNYYRPDDESNELVIYPRPATVTWDIPDITEFMDDAAGINSNSEAWIINTEYGIGYMAIDADGQLFMAYEFLPADIVETTDTSDFPAWLIRVVEYATMERAFGADTDGFIPSLRDYWKTRKDVSIEAVKKFRRMKLADRDFVMGGGRKKQVWRHPTLGDHYPAQYP